MATCPSGSGSGLQNRVHGFDSRRRLHLLSVNPATRAEFFVSGSSLVATAARSGTHRALMRAVTVEPIAQVLAITGLAVATELYFLLIRRRRRARDEEAERTGAERRRLAVIRFRHLRRRDET